MLSMFCNGYDKEKHYTFKLSNQKTLFVTRDNVIFRRVTCPVPSCRAEGMILNLSYCDIKLSHARSRESCPHQLKAMKNVVFLTSDSVLSKLISNGKIFGILLIDPIYRPINP